MFDDLGKRSIILLPFFNQNDQFAEFDVQNAAQISQYNQSLSLPSDWKYSSFRTAPGSKVDAGKLSSLRAYSTGKKFFSLFRR